MARPRIYKIVSRADGTFTLNQEANGGWYHDTKYPSEEAARAAVEARNTANFPAIIDQDYVPAMFR